MKATTFLRSLSKGNIPVKITPFLSRIANQLPNIKEKHRRPSPLPCALPPARAAAPSPVASPPARAHPSRPVAVHHRHTVPLR